MRILVALGGNALLERGQQPDADIQLAHIRSVAGALAHLTVEHQVIICHGNGPQVGLLSMESESDPSLHAPYPLDSLVAQTQGMIGYWLVQALHNAGVTKPTVGVITQTLVNPDDPAFKTPTKFIGAAYTRSRAQALAKTRGWTVAPDGQAWRRVVASPAPVGIVELGTIRSLVARGIVVICAGGGGAPVIETEGNYVGVDAVVDKDLVSALLATQLDCDRLLILTDVTAVMTDFGTPQAAEIRSMTLTDLGSQTFAAGSMGPKIQACARFVEKTGNPASIGSITDVAEILTGRAGTTISGR